VATEVVNRQRLVRLDLRRLRSVADAALVALDRTSSSVAIAFVRDRTIKRLNRTHRGTDRGTDVLSFPAHDPDRDRRSLRLEDANYLGDVVVSVETARLQSERAGHSLEREVSELVIHGVLHLCGYDHETDRGEMNRMEWKLRRKLLDKR